jgi:hypothetical protein
MIQLVSTSLGQAQSGVLANGFPFGLAGLRSVSVRFTKRRFLGENAKKFGLVGLARFTGGEPVNRTDVFNVRLYCTVRVAGVVVTVPLVPVMMQV